ncbi:unnamed protein product [Prorocentrum cordatum]|uniref:Nucleotide-diphospho-sugar transferase domain-containing protein n=1 Tax=Prorocentrum cordatum TaxID=2364126 RepID=A0ABN9PIP2_9DINO|nr:unnamed protein product [Polarella glacialis]
MSWPPAPLAGPASVAPQAVFQNHDCVGLASPILDWDRLREGLRTDCGHTRQTRTLRCAARISGWEAHVVPFLRLHQPDGGGLGAERAESTAPSFEAFDRVEPAARAECPLGVTTLNIARTLLCARSRDLDCYLLHTRKVSADLYNTPLTVMMGTDWPMFALLNSYSWVWPGAPPGQDYDCIRSNRSTINWPALLNIFAEDPMSAYGTVSDVFDTNLAFHLNVGSRECLYGVYIMNIVKTMWAADTESSSYQTYSPYMGYVLYESLHLLGAARWPLFALIHHFTSIRRHGFRIDFSGEHLELVGFAGANRGGPGRLAGAARAFRAALGRARHGLRLVYVTMVYGHMSRLRTIGVGNLVMATLDGEAFSRCAEFFYRDQCVNGSVSVLNKYTFLLVALQLGIDVMWLDFDIFIVRDPGPALAMATEGYDLLMGYDYTSDCLCNGFFYLRARPVVHTWLHEMVRWLYDHPYEHDQRAIAAFLNYTERISAAPEDFPDVPRWHVLDVDNSFINFGSWEGHYEDLVLVHFVDGSAFSLYGRPTWDPSIPRSKLEWVKDRHDGPGVASDEPLSPLQAFYASAAVAAGPEEIWRAGPELRGLLDAQVRPRPASRQRCGIMPDISGGPGVAGCHRDGLRFTWACRVLVPVGTVKRTKKEYDMYLKEEVAQRAKIDTMKAEGADDADVKKQIEALLGRRHPGHAPAPPEVPRGAAGLHRRALPGRGRRGVRGRHEDAGPREPEAGRGGGELVRGMGGGPEDAGGAAGGDASGTGGTGDEF